MANPEWNQMTSDSEISIEALRELMEMAPQRPWEYLGDHSERGQLATKLMIASVKVLPRLIAEQMLAAAIATETENDLRARVAALEDKIAVDAEYAKMTRDVLEDGLHALRGECTRLADLALEAANILEIHNHYSPTPHPVLVKLRNELGALGRTPKKP